MRKVSLVSLISISILLILTSFGWQANVVNAADPMGSSPVVSSDNSSWSRKGMVTQADREAAAARAAAARATIAKTAKPKVGAPLPGGTPDYFGIYPNYANSPQTIINIPTVTITGVGSGATATAQVLGVVSIAVTAGGTGYTSAPAVYITGGGGIGATATATVAGGAVTVITVTNGGTHYFNTPSVSFGGGGGTGAAATATVGSGIVTGIEVVTGGTGYTVAPSVAITGGGGTGAVASSTVAGGVVTAITVTNGGSGYGGVTGSGLRKFIDALPNIPAANPDTISYPGSDYYEISLRQYTQKMHTDVPPTTLRGYVQTNNGTNSGTQLNTVLPSPIQYLGPLIVAQRDRPVRIKFTNQLPTGVGGNLFIPVDTTIMGAGVGPNGGTETYKENRATLHLHGGITPWISDGTPHQWITPATETTSYPEGVSVSNVPDMPDPGAGSMTFFYSNQQSARLMFYHDHAYGITRLNVYAGEAAGYLLQDPVEQNLVSTGVIPSTYIPLVIQDKSFVDPTKIATQDPTWNWGTTPGTPHAGDLWHPHVYMPAQNPYDAGGANAMGRWHYGPWFWPPTTNIEFGPVPNPYYDPVNAPWEPPEMPGTPNPSWGAEAFMDTPVVNGMAYPYLDVQPRAYRFGILNAANDRFFNLHLFQADPTITTGAGVAKEVKMVPSVVTPGFPALWPTDGREGGVPDPTLVGPSMLQIGSEGGFLPFPTVIAPQPIAWNTDPTTFNFGNVSDHSMLLGPAERADVIIDFSQYPGKTLILYNDAPAAFPALDPRYDYYTGNPDLTDTGGAPTTLPGYGPNTRTIMQIRVANTAPVVYNPAPLYAAFTSTSPTTGVFRLTQDPIIVKQSAYNTAYNASYPGDAYARIQDNSLFIGLPITSMSLIKGGSGYTSAPTVSITGGGGTGATAAATISGITSFTIVAGGNGYTTVPAITLTGGGGSGATAIATIRGGNVDTITVTNRGSGYTSAPTVTITGGGGSGAVATATASIGVVTGVTLTNGGTGYNSPPIVTINGGAGTGATAKANGLPMEPKAIQDEMGESFDEYGRMAAKLGLELPFTVAGNQNFILKGFQDPATEIIRDSITPISPVAGDGTQIWKITHNGVDTHTVHFHLFNVQLVNRVGWDGAIRPPDDNELGWKETIRVSPLEDTIVALRPVAPKMLFGIPNSNRPLDPTRPIGSTMGFSTQDANGNPITVTNQLTNFDWEYVWHCHLLSHEENDMMRPMVFQVQTALPTASVLNATSSPVSVNLTWTDPTPKASPGTLGNPANEVGFRIYRAIVTNGQPGAYTQIGTALANATSYADTAAFTGIIYRYYITAWNATGTTNSNTVTVTGGSSIPAPTLILPTNGSISVGGSVDFSWNAVTGVTGYMLNIATTPDFSSGVKFNNAVGANTTYTDTGYVAGTTYYWRVYALNGVLSSPASAIWNFTTTAAPLPPVLINPVNASTVAGTSIGFQWNASSGATGYWLTVSRVSDGSTVISQYVGNLTTYNLGGFPNNGTQYRWAVAAGNSTGWSAGTSATFTNGTGTVIPAAPTLISPANSSTVGGTSINFQWNASSGATGYWLTVSRVSDSSTVISQYVGNVTSFNQGGFPDNGTQYRWAVAAGNSTGWSAGTSAIFTNGTGTVIPAAPTLISPANSSTVGGTSINFQWNASSGATGYWLTVSRVSDSSTVISQYVGNVTSFNQGGFPDNGTQYRWAVAAGNSTGWSAGTSAIFTNGTGTVIPAAPTLISPANSSTVGGTSINFQWNASSGATGYWLTVSRVSDSSTVISQYVGNVTSFNQGGFPNNGTQYRWAVAAGNSTGWSAGTIATFTN